MFVLKSTLEQKERNWLYRYQNLEEHHSRRIRQLELRTAAIEQRYLILLEFLKLETVYPPKNPKPYLKHVNTTI